MQYVNNRNIKELGAQREARLWAKIRDPRRPPNAPRKQWEAELRAAFSELGVHGPIQRLTPPRSIGKRDRLNLTAEQKRKRWHAESQRARRALNKSGEFRRRQVRDREVGRT